MMQQNLLNYLLFSATCFWSCATDQPLGSHTCSEASWGFGGTTCWTYSKFHCTLELGTPPAIIPGENLPIPERAPNLAPLCQQIQHQHRAGGSSSSVGTLGSRVSARRAACVLRSCRAGSDLLFSPRNRSPLCLCVAEVTQPSGCGVTGAGQGSPQLSGRVQFIAQSGGFRIQKGRREPGCYPGLQHLSESRRQRSLFLFPGFLFTFCFCECLLYIKCRFQAVWKCSRWGRYSKVPRLGERLCTVARPALWGFPRRLPEVSPSPPCRGSLGAWVGPSGFSSFVWPGVTKVDTPTTWPTWPDLDVCLGETCIPSREWLLISTGCEENLQMLRSRWDDSHPTTCFLRWVPEVYGLNLH